MAELDSELQSRGLEFSMIDPERPGFSVSIPSREEIDDDQLSLSDYSDSEDLDERFDEEEEVHAGGLLGVANAFWEMLGLLNIVHHEEVDPEVVREEDHQEEEVPVVVAHEEERQSGRAHV